MVFLFLDHAIVGSVDFLNATVHAAILSILALYTLNGITLRQLVYLLLLIMQISLYLRLGIEIDLLVTLLLRIDINILSVNLQLGR